MKKLRVEEAVGLKLCHDMTKVIPGKFKGIAFKRDHVIRPEDVEELLSIGKEHVFVWEENAGEIHEDEAAVRIAQAVMGESMFHDQPQEGKTILRATDRGLFKVNRTLLREVNSIENVTIASMPNNFMVEKGDKLAGARIIPLVIKEEKIKQLERICLANGPVFNIRPYKKLRVGVIVTGNEVYKGRIEDKFWPVIEEKLGYYETKILGQIYCPDEMAELQKSISSYQSKGADLIILTGGMSVDPDDLTPGAIKNSGAEIVTYGAPIQPGNMFMLAYLDDTILMGVPGAAIHSKTTVLDVVLPRVFTGERLTKQNFIDMSEGGLCLNCKVCKYPICYFGRGVEG
ncbi:MAG: molybdopterin-binding protein [Gracilibacter sp. BRH_c7a]|nr:MAG: molybdopterin-binding protein [Gracilibacter sp. BRH_c7a]